MTLADRLAGKSRRRTVVRVLVADPGPATEALGQAQTLALAAFRPGGDPAAVTDAESAVAAAQADLDACYESLEVQALEPWDYDALVTEHTTDEGDVDTDALLPHLAAACALDESVQDPDWWATQLASGNWTAGERDHLYHELYLLNYGVPGQGPGKG